MQKIDYKFKVLSCIGVILVLCGHYGVSALTFGNLFKYDTFHMPLFVFISGCFYKNSNHETLRILVSYIKKKFMHLMLPYYFWNCVYGLVSFVLCNNPIFQYTIGKGTPFTLYTLFIQPFQMGNGFEINVAGWFVGALFLVELFNSICKYIFCKLKLKSDLVHMIIFLIGGYIAIILAQSTWKSSWKIAITRTLYLMFWYECGYFYKKYLEIYDKRISTIAKVIVIVLLQVAVIIIMGDNEISIVYTSVYPYRPEITMLKAILGIMFWINVANVLTPLIGQSPIVLFISKHAFSYMMHQGLIGLGINLGILVINKIFGGFPDFDMEYYRSNIWYSYTKNDLTEIHVIYVILILFIISCIIMVYEYFLGFVKKRLKR